MRSLRVLGMLVVLLLPPAVASAGGLRFVEFEQATNPPSNGLRNPVDVASHGDHLYVVSKSEDAVSVWLRDFNTNEVSFVELETDGTAGVTGMRNPNAAAVTLDGLCLFVATDDNQPGPGGAGTLVVFDRNPVGGGLGFLEVHADDTAGVDGIGGAIALIASIDGKHVYVLGERDEAIAVFGRTAPACGLTFLGLVQNNAGGVQGLGRPQAITISPDDAHVYATGRVAAGGGYVGTVVAFARDAVSGALTFVELEQEGVAGVERLLDPVSAVAMSGNGDDVYVTSAGGDSVIGFARDTGTGALTYLETERRAGSAKGFKGASGITVGFSDDYVFVTGRGDDAVAVFKRHLATGLLDFLELHDDPVPGTDVLGGAEAVAIAFDFSGGVFVAGSGPDTLAAFTADRCGDGIRGVDEQCDDGCLAGIAGFCEPADGGDGCSPLCRLELCGPVVTGTCHAATPSGGSQLQIKDQSEDRKDQLKWKWSGEATTLAEFGDPVTTATYVLCVYDGSANPQPLLSRAAGSGGTCDGKPCWKAKPTSFQYADKLLTPDGLKKVALKEGLVDGKPKVQVQGAGIFLDPPALPLTLPVTVQVRTRRTASAGKPCTARRTPTTRRSSRPRATDDRATGVAAPPSGRPGSATARARQASHPTGGGSGQSSSSTVAPAARSSSGTGTISQRPTVTPSAVPSRRCSTARSSGVRAAM